jgi:hypothetical protein
LVSEFISEDDLKTFEGWMQYQGIHDVAALTPDELEMWKHLFAEASVASAAAPKVGLMNLARRPGHKWAVAIRDGSDLWLTLWLLRSLQGDFYIFWPRGDGQWNPHVSYHVDGTFHSKSWDRRHGQRTKRQRPDGAFKGTEHLGIFAGHGIGSGAVCDPSVFSGIVEIPKNVLGPIHGAVAVDLVEPGCEPLDCGFKQIVQRETFRHAIPWVVITVGYND